MTARLGWAGLKGAPVCRRATPDTLHTHHPRAPQDAKRLCREVVDAVQRLRAGRDMTVNEIRLTLAIESPIVREQREFMGIEVRRFFFLRLQSLLFPVPPARDRPAACSSLNTRHSPHPTTPVLQTGSGVSRDDIAAALGDITAGRIPADRLALKELHREMMEWPFITAPAAGGGAGGASKYEPERTGGAAGWRRGQARPVPMGRDASETPQVGAGSGGWGGAVGVGGAGVLGACSFFCGDCHERRPGPRRRGRWWPQPLPALQIPQHSPHHPSTPSQTLADRLPDWMGYGFLYFVSVIPVIIAGSVVAVLFFNSLK